FKDLKIPYIPNVNATAVTDKDKIKDLLQAQVSSPVMWEQTLYELEKMGVDTIIEVGPGRTIAGFVRKTVPGIKVIGVSTPEDIEKLLQTIG
ncbi:MAG: ACP S-malonyltransferase, partial [Clostridiales bacterium]|nr:ACP S-malonyltransferase [Clostridiales bacterium]